MKLIKYQETEIIKVYDTWLNSYLNGDVKTYNFYLDKEYRFIGSTNNEDFLNKTDTTKFFKATAGQLAGKVEIRNSRRTLEKFDELVFITDLFDAYFISDEEWGYYGKFRFTSALKKNEEGWRFIYQHFSTPDSKAQEGETIGTEKITAENLMLREAVQRRTIELEQKSRELEIEAALEKIRSRSMAMHKSDELQEIVNIVFEKLVELKVETDVVSVIILKEDLAEMEYWVANSKQINSVMYRIIHNDDILILKDVMVSRKSGLDFSKDYTFDEKNQLWEYLYLHSDFKNTPDERKKFVLNTPAYTTAVSFAKNTAVQLNRYYKKPFTDDEKGILKRITKVFEQTYTRFLDLQKAEAQAREAQIQLALERVRARTMAMQKSDELQETAALLFMQVTSLGVPAFSCGFNIWEKGDKTFNAFMTGYENTIEPAINLPFNEEPNFKRFDESKRKGEDFYVLEMRGKAMQKHYQYLKRTVPVFREAFDKILESGLSLPETQIHHIANFSKGNLMFITLEPCPEAHDIFKRFAKVFEQTYTRFLDLQKAEAQAREAQIEAALEKVRSRSLAMHTTSELGEVVTVIVEKLTDLGVVLDANGVVLCTYFQNSKDVLHWIASSDFSFAGSYLLPYFDHPIFNDAWQSKESGEAYFSKAYSIEEKNSFFEYAFEHSDYRHFPDDFKQWVFLNDKHILSFAWQKNSAILIPSHTGVVPTEDEAAILKRFAKVFEQAYTRFLDLQKAETQAREARIEASLERVRSKAMAMHSSEDLAATIGVFYHEMVSLSTRSIIRCGAGLLSRENQIVDLSSVSRTAEGKIVEIRGKLDMSGHTMLQNVYDHWLLMKEYHHVLRGNEIKEYYQYARKQVEIPDYPNDVVQYAYFPMFSEGSFYVFTENELTENELQVYRRFTSVLSLTYKRYNDLKHAEAQVREAQIEAALEKVRSRTIGMQRSDELQEAAVLLFQQVVALGVPAFGSGFNIWDDGRKFATAWMGGQDRMQPPFKTSSSEDIFLRIYEAAQRGELLFVEEQGGEALKSHYEYMISIPIFKEIADKMAKAGQSFPTFQIMHCAFFSHGYLMFISFEPVPDAYDIFKRFAKVFEQTYTRFLDLQKAEAQAREAIKQASLDRVRGEIASMRTKDDLNRITPLIWKELNALGVPFIRCGVFIMNEEKRMIQTYLSTPDGKSLTAFEMAYDTERVAAGAVFHWNKKEIYKDHWDKKQFVGFMQNLVKTGQIKNAESFQGTSAPPDSLDLHFLPFKQGMLYVGNISPLAREELQLVQSLADSFSIAYARYEDFRQLEVAKNQIEKTFTELKATQSQLIQSEKMASLGELTAGIAHEIQNPLNFVNNFSELSNELMEEMKEELEESSRQYAAGSRQSGEENLNLAKEIAGDIKQNLEKINHHGKRAADIVKGMLQHSRTSNGVKEPTDINALADEYLRLAYHGLRAKDKSFNADFKTDFDPNLPKINVIQQDIGRVLLNLINNAFYAVDKKAKDLPPQPPEGGVKNDQNIYRPTVTVRTTSSKSPLGDLGVKISVKDNGSGIPAQIVDKIFQPFFTTKPTGSGTGLGLSVSYDIVKAHGGELKVDSQEGIGTVFSVMLKLQN